MVGVRCRFRLWFTFLIVGAGRDASGTGPGSIWENMKLFSSFLKLSTVGGLLAGLLGLFAQRVGAQAAKPAAPAAVEASKIVDAEQFLGTFAITSHKYTVVAHEKGLTRASDPKFGTTLGEIEIRGTNGATIYRKSFSADLMDGHFAKAVTASASVFQGVGGAALVIRYVEEPAAPGEDESWQVFGLVNNKLTLLGPPLPPGQGDGIAVGGVLTGVMVGGGVNVMPLASKAEELEFRAWTGNFFVYVPVRVDWDQGQWGEGETCFANTKGTLTKTGCNMRILANARPQAQGLVVSLYAEPVEDPYHAEQVAVVAGSKFELLAARAIVNWGQNGDRVTCSFEDMWLRVRVKDGKEGWIHSGPDFVALGLPAGAPPQ